LLCYRCGSYNADGNRTCSVCGQAFSPQRRQTKNPARDGGTGSTRLKAPIEPGTRIAGRYRVIDSSGQGAAGWVLRARDEEVDVDVALKLVSANLLQTEDERHAFLRTVKLAKRVQHPNIARIYDEGRDERGVYYTAAHLEGLTLRKIIDLRLEKNQVFSVAETLPLFGQLALGLDAFEDFGAHGALRPSNVMILPDVLKITGLAHWQGLPRRPFVALQQQRHATEYLAPEARREGGKIDGRADVYSMAVIFGEMLAGQVFGRDPLGWTRALRGLPRRLAGLLSQGLAERAADRFPTATAFFDALAEAVADMQFDAEPVSLDDAQRAPEALGDDSTDVEGQVPRPESSRRPAAAGSPAPMRLPQLVDQPTPLPPNPEPSEPSQAESRSEVAPHLLNREHSFTDAAPRRRLERRGSPLAAGLWVWALAGSVVLGGGGVAAAIWWRNAPVSHDAPAPAAMVPEIERTRLGGSPDDDRRALTGAVERLKKPAAAPRKPAPEERRPEPSARPKIIEVEPAEERDDTPSGRQPITASSGRQPVTSSGADDDRLRTPPGGSTPEPEPEPEAEPARPPNPPEAPPAVTSKNCPSGMVSVERSSFELGSSASDPMRGFGELAASRTNIAPFCIDVYEYPNQRGKTPTVNVSWQKAKQSCEQKGKRLCTEAEWEHACKGGRNLRFPFGDDWIGGTCNLGEGSGMNRRPAGSGDFGKCRSIFGIADLAGNVAEWTASRWSDDVDDKVVKGGAADQASYTGRCAARVNESPGGKGATLGFRCCSSAK
jgi:eukaryotic-like serine/threonine-protein kinase